MEPEVSKRKLSISSSEFTMSPSRDGYTLTVRLSNANEVGKKSSNRDGKLKKVANDAHRADSGEEDVDSPKLAIVAVRVLVGSTTKDFCHEILLSWVGQLNLLKT
jgi:hypothetical protein